MRNIYIYCVCVILKSPMSPWCVLLTWQGAKKAILWTAVPSWNQEPRCFGGGTITMVFYLPLKHPLPLLPYILRLSHSQQLTLAHCQGDRQYRPKPDDDTADTASRQHLCASKPAAHNAHKQLTDAMNNLQHMQRLRALVYKASVGLILWRKTTKIDEDLGPWKVGVGQSLPEIYSDLGQIVVET